MLSDFEEIQVFEDGTTDTDIIENYIVESESQEDAFYIADIGNIIERHQDWFSKMPKVIPYYTVNCNPNSTVIKVLAALNACFNCSSQLEIEEVMQYGVQGERIIFTNPNKFPSHIKYSREVNVARMVVDNEHEFLKIKDHFPEAKIVIHICCEEESSPDSMENKFGRNSYDNAVFLMQHVKIIGLNLHGFSFNVAQNSLSLCSIKANYLRGIDMCKQLITKAKSIGCNDVKLINIGDVSNNICEKALDELAEVINNAIENLDPNISVITELREYYVKSSFTLATYLHSKKHVVLNNEITKIYYVNCGVYNSFLNKLIGMEVEIPELLTKPANEKNEEKYLSSIRGPTNDCNDLILKDVLLPEFYIGEWLLWKNMGLYTLALSTTYNGFPIPDVKPFIRRDQWEYFQEQILTKFLQKEKK